MKINRNNYEQYFIDHLDGRLDASLLKELEEFLIENPDLKEEFEGFEPINVNIQDEFIYEEKEGLKKIDMLPTSNINNENYNHFFIASVEGDLSLTKQEEVKTFIRLNPQLQTQYNLFKATRVIPDQSIVFANKSNLKKYPFGFFKTWYKPIGIAASILLLFGILNFLQPKKPNISYEKRAEVPTIIKSRLVGTFQTETINPPITARGYQYAINYTAEELPIEELTKLPSVIRPIKSYIASLQQPVQPIEFLLHSNSYDQIFKEMIIHEELLLASFGKSDPSANEKLEKALWAKSLGKLKRRNQQPETYSDDYKKSKINLWTLASIGIESFNVITGSNVNIERKLNKEGEKSKYILVNANGHVETTDQPN